MAPARVARRPNDNGQAVLTNDRQPVGKHNPAGAKDDQLNGIHTPVNGKHPPTNGRELQAGAGRPVLPNWPSAQSQVVQEALRRNSTFLSAAAEEMQQVPFWRRIHHSLRALLLICVLLVTTPYSVFAVMVGCAYKFAKGSLPWKQIVWCRQHSRRQATRTAMVTGTHMTKGLAVCRQLHAAGWRVVAVDFDKWWMAMARYSVSVDAFYTVPDPGKDPEGYMRGIVKIAQQEQVKLIVPSASPNYSIYDSILRDRLPADCRTVALDAELTATLDDKVKFSTLCDQIGVRVPANHKITSTQQLFGSNANNGEKLSGHKYLLKKLAYDPKHRSDLFTLPCSQAKLEQYLRSVEVSDSSPWILQQWLDEPEYSCYTVAHQGRVVAHADNIASLSCLNFSHVNNQEIWEWMVKFCDELKLTGHVCVDFMRDSHDGHLYSIECNPRLSTVLLAFHDNHALGQALTEPATIKGVVKPLPSSKPVHWFWNEAFTAYKSKNIRRWLEALIEGVDAVFDADDPLPFLALHHLQAPVLLLRIAAVGRPWTKLDLCIGKVSELGGD